MQAYSLLNFSKKYGVIIEDLLTQLDEALILSYQFAIYSKAVSSFLDEVQYWSRQASRPEVEAMAFRYRVGTKYQFLVKKQPSMSD